MENKKTAVEWLVESLTELGVDLLQHKTEIIIAKEMEKDNSLDSFFAGYNYEGGHPIDEHIEYYQKTYGKSN